MGVSYWQFLGEEGDIKAGPRVTATRRFVARTASAADSFLTVASDRRCPQIGDRHPNSALLVVSGVTPNERAGFPKLWDVEVEYDSVETEDQEENPLARPAEIDWDEEEERQLAERDGEGNAYVNTAGELLEGVEDDVAFRVARVSKNVAKLPRWVWYYALAVNSDAVRIEGETFGPETLKLRRLRRSKLQRENKVQFYTMSFELHYREEGWFKWLANRGYHELVEREGITPFANLKRFLKPHERYERRRILINGEPPAEAQWLDREGRQVRDKDGNVKTKLDPEDFVFLEFKSGPRRPFSVLPLK